MKQRLIEELEKLKNNFTKNENKYQAYKKNGSKLILISKANTKSDINKNISELLEDLVKDNIEQIIIIYYIISLKSDKVFGVLSMTCEIIPITDKGKLSKKNVLVSSIHYNDKELEERGLKKGDYKILVNKLLNGEISSEIKKIYTAKNLDE